MQTTEDTEKRNHREHGGSREKETLARRGCNQREMAVLVPPATHSRGGMKIFAGGEDLRG
jgi:hypothetical protein